MSEQPDRKRGWWSRITGADGQSAEETIQQLAQEVVTARETIDVLTAQREQLRESAVRKVEEQAAAATRARAETEAVRRAAEAQLSALRGQLENLRAEQAKERATFEQKLRDAHVLERDAATRITALQRDLGNAGKEQATVRTTLKQEQAKNAHLTEELAAARAALQRAQHEASRLGEALAEARAQLGVARAQNEQQDAEIADARTSLLDLRSQLDELGATLERTQAAARQLDAVAKLALETAVGPDGAQLALAIARREAAVDLAVDGAPREAPAASTTVNA